MKKFSFFAGLVGMLASVLSTPVSAVEPFGSNWSFCNDCSILDGKFTVGADWLYWQIDNCNSDFAVRSSLGTFGRGHVKRPRSDYNSGFRVRLGYELPCDCWEAGITYTNIPSDSRRVRDRARSGSSIITLEDTFGLPFDVDGLRAKWERDLSYLDLDFARNFCVGECFTFRPHIGPRFFWFDHKVRLRADVAALSAVEARARIKDKLNGYGVQGGFWGDWKVGAGLSVVGHVGGSVLYTRFRKHVRSGASESSLSSSGSNSAAAIAGFDLRDRFWCAVPSFDYFLGLQYADCFCDMSVTARIGWEQHIWLDANQIFLSRNGNISTQGLTLGLDVVF